MKTTEIGYWAEIQLNTKRQGGESTEISSREKRDEFYIRNLPKNVVYALSSHEFGFKIGVYDQKRGLFIEQHKLV